MNCSIKLPLDCSRYTGMSHVLDKYQLWRHVYSTDYHIHNISCSGSLKTLWWTTVTGLWLWLTVFRHLAKYTVSNSCFFFILKMFTYVQLSLYADINMKSKKKAEIKNTCLNLAYGILASQSFKVLQETPIRLSPACECLSWDVVSVNVENNIQKLHAHSITVYNEDVLQNAKFWIHYCPSENLLHLGHVS